MTVHLVLPAAGVGRRFGASIPKQYVKVAGKAVMDWTLERCAQWPVTGYTVMAVAEGDRWLTPILEKYPNVHTVHGGAERFESVLNALHWLARRAQPQDWVLVHDIARPNIKLQDVQTLLSQCFQVGHGAILAKPLTDTIKQRQADGLLHTLDRTTLWAALTPQCFPLQGLLTALTQATQVGCEVTDEASAMELFGHAVGIVEGASSNIKLTSSADAELLAFYLNQQG